MKTNDAVSGAIVIALAIVMMLLTLSFPPFPGQKYGPSLFPRLLGIGIVFCGILLVVRGLRDRTAGQPLVSFPDWIGEPWRLVSFLLVPILTLVCYATFDPIGFVPVCAVTLTILFAWFRVPPVRAVGYAILATVLLQYFFGKLMRVPLPLGWLLNLPPGWLKYIT